jgi:uncharacterized membrane protein YfcA
MYGKFLLFEALGVVLTVYAYHCIRAEVWRGRQWVVSHRKAPVRFWLISALSVAIALGIMAIGFGFLFGVVPLRHCQRLCAHFSPRATA